MSMHLLARPTPEELEQFLRLRLRERLLVQVAGECEVVYVGRAASLTEAGDRLVIVKADGSVQVQGPRGIKPVNWQPRTDDLRVLTDEDGRVRLIAERRNPVEFVDVTFNRPDFAAALAMREDASFQLHGTEAQMQAALARDPGLVEPGLTLLARELIVGVGGVDLLARDTDGRVVVVELKRGKARQEDVHQLCRYVDAVREQVPVLVRGILAAPSITAPARTVLARAELEFVDLSALPVEKQPDRQPALF